MKASYFFLFVLGIWFTSCSSDDDNDDSTVTETFNFLTNSQIEVSEDSEFTFVSIGTGAFLVFEYELNDNGQIDIADDESSTRFLFQIDPELESFSFSDEELVTIQAYHLQSSAFISLNTPVNQGTVQGIRLDNQRWDITIDITLLIEGVDAPVEVELQVEGIFELN